MLADRVPPKRPMQRIVYVCSIPVGVIQVNRHVVLFALILAWAPAIFLLDSQLARASQSVEKTARVGFVGTESLSRGVPAFWERLHELGWIEGKNLSIETRWAEGHVERLSTLMNELIARKVDVLFTYGTRAAIAAKRQQPLFPSLLR